MKALIIILLVTHNILNCNQMPPTRQVNTPDEIVNPNITILPYDARMHQIFKDGLPAELKTTELQTIEAMLTACVDTDNNQKENLQYPPIVLEKYYRQYIAIINERGEKEVWINCFCETFGNDWKKSILIVDDGGQCFFNLKVNLQTRQCYDFFVNGEA